MSAGVPLRSYLPPGVLLLLVAGLLAVSYGYPPQSRAMPLLVGWTMVALLALDIASRTPTRTGHALLVWPNPAVLAGKGRPQGAAPETEDQEPAGTSLKPVVSIVLFGIGLGVAGTLVAVPAYVALALRLQGRHSLTVAGVAACATLLFVYGLFSLLLKLPMFPGLLFGGAF